MDIFIREYLAMLKLERNLSENTIASYKNDLSSFLKFLEDAGIKDPSLINPKLLNDFFGLLTKLGLSSRSAARYYSSVKGFFGYLFSSAYIEINPMEKISAPKVSKGLPNVLNINEIENILSQPDTSKKLGLRDKALLETFYACGLRVSELITLKISDMFLNEEMIRVFGKGSKERFVPIGSSAIKWIEEYLKNSRPLLEKKAKSQHVLFLNNRGTKLSRMGVWKIVDKYVKLAGIKKEVHPHTLQTFVCNTSSGRRRRSPCCAGNAWTRGYFHNTDLHSH